MKDKIHPAYIDCTVSCNCGVKVQTRATKASIHVEVCSNCHPFFTQQQRFVDTAGRVEKFVKKYQKKAPAVAAAPRPAAAAS